jgi:hypothetical protein
MKKHLLTALAAGVFVTGALGNVWANTIVYNEKFNPADILLNATGPVKSVTWTFDLTDNNGWETQGQVFTNGVIKLDVQDDKGAGDGSEKGLFTYEGNKSTKKATQSDINSAYWKNIFIVDSSVFGDGIVSVTLTATTGDFWFRGLQLTVMSNYTPDLSAFVPNLRLPEFTNTGVNEGTNIAPVPEPTTMLLFGTGIAGLAAVSRRKRS